MFNNPVLCNRKDSLVSRGSFAVSLYTIDPLLAALSYLPSNYKKSPDICVKPTQGELRSRLTFTGEDRLFEIVAFGDVFSLAYSVLKACTNLKSNFFRTTNLKD